MWENSLEWTAQRCSDGVWCRVLPLLLIRRYRFSFIYCVCIIVCLDKIIIVKRINAHVDLLTS